MVRSRFIVETESQVHVGDLITDQQVDESSSSLRNCTCHVLNSKPVQVSRYHCHLSSVWEYCFYYLESFMVRLLLWVFTAVTSGSDVHCTAADRVSQGAHCSLQGEKTSSSLSTDKKQCYKYWTGQKKTYGECWSREITGSPLTPQEAKELWRLKACYKIVRIIMYKWLLLIQTKKNTVI